MERLKLNCLNEKEMIYNFNNLWADNADYMSIQYSGTNALKTDFTRYGKRTLSGVLSDGYNSAKRYILNNFFDGNRQVTIIVFYKFF